MPAPRIKLVPSIPWKDTVPKFAPLATIVLEPTEVPPVEFKNKYGWFPLSFLVTLIEPVYPSVPSTCS